MTHDQELTKLRKELARSKQRTKIERTKLDLEIEKRKIKRELFILKNPTVSRIGKGLKVLGKKAGSAIGKQATLMRERQEQERKTGKKKKPSSIDKFDPFRLDF